MKESKQGRKAKHDVIVIDEPKGASKPVSLHPLSFDEALKGLLEVRPEPKGETNKNRKRATVKKR
ncbi:MAG: hypothetical protein M3430_14905 [Acidobacteriota bacterium]|nr:hypothetical protein [Acidobacteriota bacterium]